jgi:hypothetical protein
MISGAVLVSILRLNEEERWGDFERIFRRTGARAVRVGPLFGAVEFVPDCEARER